MSDSSPRERSGTATDECSGRAVMAVAGMDIMMAIVMAVASRIGRCGNCERQCSSGRRDRESKFRMVVPFLQTRVNRGTCRSIPLPKSERNQLLAVVA